MGHYLHIFSLVKVPQGLSWRQIVWKQFPLLSPPHTPKNLNDCSGSLRGEPLHTIIQLLISTSCSWLSPSRNVSHTLQIMLLVHREAAKEHELVCPQPSACPHISADWWRLCPAHLPLNFLAQPLCLDVCVRFPITWRVRNHWVFLVSTLESSKPIKAF